MVFELTFDGIASAGRAIVEAHKKKRGFEEGIRRLLSELYPDNAHFIYELLQNAEDAGASVVQFELRADALEVRHNGSRAFSLEDIDSIANIGNSTKKDDETQIGKFGVGFKAVYSYTTRPQIRSGEFCFAIGDLFVPERIDGRADGGWTTFFFPFDRADKPPATACTEVERGLRELDEKTLLFLNNIREITYELQDRDIGFVTRMDLDDLTIRVEASQGEEFVESTWLRLVGPASNAHGSQSPLTVAAAFKLEPKAPGRTRSTTKPAADAERTWGIVPLSEGDVSIYFPAEKETSRLRFHIHAPFASTVARDSVRDTSENAQLVADIGALIVANLKGFRDRSLIDEGLLAALPNTEDDLKPIYGQIRSAVVEAFNEEPLTPVRGGGGYGPARSLVASPSEFRSLLEPADLRFLIELGGQSLDDAPRWVRDLDGRAGRFLRDLDTQAFGWGQLSSALQQIEYLDDEPDEVAEEIGRAWHTWLAGKTDEKLLNIYELLGHEDDDFWADLQELPLIRLRTARGVTHVKGHETHLPATPSDKAKTRVPVELAYFDGDEATKRSNNLRSFYSNAGVRRWDEQARVERRLAIYRDDKFPELQDGSVPAKHLDDMRAFVQFGRANPGNTRMMFRNVPLVLVVDEDGDLVWVRPDAVYVDEPFRTTGLSALYGDNTSRHPLPGFYLDVEGIDDFLVSLGALANIEIRSVSVFQNPEFKREWLANHRQSNYTQSNDWRIQDLEDIARTADPILLHTLWNTVVDAKASKASALYQANRSAGRHVFSSQLQRQLTTAAWVLDRNGEVRLPRELTLDEIPEGWRSPSDDSLIHRLGFGADAAKQQQQEAAKPHYAEQLGIGLQDAELIKEARAAGVDIEAAIQELIAFKRSQEVFPDVASDDPTRRAELAALDADGSPVYETEIRARSVVVGQGPSMDEAKAYLREQYTSAAGDMYCQACQAILPFKVKGKWYFEAVQFVGNRNRTHRQNVLALCPLCAAKYRYKRETSDETLLESLSETAVEAGQGTIELPVLVHGKIVQLRMTGKHALDLQAAMAVAGEVRSPSSHDWHG